MLLPTTYLLAVTNYSGYDPEVNSNNSSSKGVPAIGIDWTTYPKARSFMLGLMLSSNN